MISRDCLRKSLTARRRKGALRKRHCLTRSTCTGKRTLRFFNSEMSFSLPAWWPWPSTARRRYFGEHLVFSLHTLSFVLLFGAIIWPYYAFSGLRVTFLIPALSFITCFFYSWRATARAYGAAGW